MAWSRRYEGSEPQRVNRWLAQAGVCSRREAESFIAAGHVFIDGERVADLGRKIDPGQVLRLDAEGARALGAAFTAVLNKPPGWVSGQPEAGQTPAVRLLTAAGGPAGADPPPRDASLAPLGRLDLDSRGLLLLSDDGVLAKAVIGPASALDKEYAVRVQGRVTKEKLARLREGLSLDGRRLKRAEVEQEDEDLLRFILREGRNRQIRRMCALVELKVEDLRRLRIGPLRLGDLPEGRWRPLEAGERAALLAAGPGPASSPPPPAL
jgi:23S rRNA pseudouridine2604 synthase